VHGDGKCVIIVSLDFGTIFNGFAMGKKPI